MTDHAAFTAGAPSTYNPILGSELLMSKLDAVRKLRSQPGVAQVMYRHGRVVQVLHPEDQITRMEALTAGFTSVTRVDVRSHDLTLVGSLPCRGGAHDFGVIMRLTCRVTDPEAIVDGNVEDTGARLHRTLFERIQDVSHDHGVDDVIRARAAVLTELGSRPLDPAFEITGLSAEFRLDDMVRDLLRAELQREFFESVVRQGPEAIAAWQLSKNPEDAQAALGILHAHRRAAIEDRRDEEQYLLTHNVVRPEQLEELALERLRRLEPPAGGETVPLAPPFGHPAHELPAPETKEHRTRED